MFLQNGLFFVFSRFVLFVWFSNCCFFVNCKQGKEAHKFEPLVWDGAKSTIKQGTHTSSRKRERLLRVVFWVLGLVKVFHQRNRKTRVLCFLFRKIHKLRKTKRIEKQQNNNTCGNSTPSSQSFCFWVSCFVLCCLFLLMFSVFIAKY